VTVALGSLLGSALTPGIAGASSASATPKPTPPPASHTVHRRTQEAPVGRVHDLMQQKFPNADAGVTLNAQHEIIVRVSGNAEGAVRSALAQTALGGRAKVVPAAHSLAQLKDLTHRIADDARSKRLDTSNIVRWGPDVSSNKVVF
jgi:hypothetical protein